MMLLIRMLRDGRDGGRTVLNLMALPSVGFFYLNLRDGIKAPGY